MSETNTAEAYFAYADWIREMPSPKREELIAAIEEERADWQAFYGAIDALMETVPPIAHIGDGHGGACLGEIWAAFEPYRAKRAERERIARGKRAIPGRLRTAVFERDAYRCVRCGSHRELQCDHIYPESKGGEATYDNLQTLCKPCNASKGARVE